MKESSQSSGLTFFLGDSDAEQKPRIATCVYGAIISMLLFVGVAGSLYALVFLRGYDVSSAQANSGALEEVNAAVLVLVGLAASAILFVCWAYKKLRIPALLTLVVLIVVWTVVMQVDMINGFNLIATQVGDAFAQSFGRIFPIFEVSAAEEDYALSATLFLIPLCLVLALLCSFLTYSSSVLLTTGVSAAVLILTVVLKQSPTVFPSLALLLAVLLITVGSFGNRANYQGRYSKGFLQISATVVVGFALVAGVLGFATWAENYKPTAAIQSMQNSIKNTIDHSRYGVNESLGMPDGDFTHLSSLSLSEETALEVTMEKPDSLWLRGYVGSIYTGNGWEEDDPKALYKHKDLFYWLHDDRFYSQTQLAHAAYVAGLAGEGETSGVKVSNVGTSSRNIYAPYEAFWANEELLPDSGIGDTSFYSEGFFGVRSYSYSTVSNQVKQFPLILNAMTDATAEPNQRRDNYLAIEGYYADFVKEMYLEVDSDLSELFDELFKGEEMDASFSSAKQAILDVLTRDVSYNEQIVPRLQNKDFITEFLKVTEEGYSVHYASAGTMMFRYLGFPARYVEGYLITPSDVKGLQGSSVITLDGTHAHAWTEVYLEGVGWIPVELTPPYLNVMEQADTLQGVNNSDGLSETESEESSDAEIDPSTQGDETFADVVFRNVNIVLWAVIITALLVITSILVLLVYRVFKRRRVLRERAELFESSDYARSITGMYHYCMDVLSALGLESREILRLPVLTPGVKSVAPAQASGFGQVFDLYEEAAYSQHAMSADQRDIIANYKDSLVHLLQEKSTGLQSIRVRLLLCLL